MLYAVVPHCQQVLNSSLSLRMQNAPLQRRMQGEAGYGRVRRCVDGSAVQSSCASVTCKGWKRQCLTC